MKLVTFNLSCDWNSCDRINSFVHRAGLIYDRLREEMPEVIAFQEVIPKSLDYLKRICPEYEFYGQFRSEHFDGEGLYTAVRKDIYEVTAFEAFWLSPAPYAPGSRFPEQSECPRICILTDLRNRKTGFRMRLMNVHLDHVSDHARFLGIQCALKKASEYQKRNPLPLAVLGDFNALPGSEPILACEEYGLTDAASRQKSTFHEFGKREEKLDYIFLSKELTSRESFVWTDNRCGIYLSDHYPTGILLEEEKK